MQPDEKIQEKLPAAHAALAACMNPLVMADLDGHVTYANAACVRFWGCSDVSEILGRDLPDFFDGPEGAAAMGELRQRGSWAGELKARRKDGSCFDVYWSGNLAVSPETGVPLCVVASCLDVTEHKRADQERAATAAILRLTNSSNDLHEVMQQLTAFLGDWSSCDAVGIRLQQGDDFPYFETRGFPEAFVVAESRLCTTDREGLTVRDAQGNPVLECMCGNILCGRFDPTKPFFTEGGSFWSNCTSRLLASTTEADRQARTRNRCNGEGYESVALVPLRFDGKTFGLLQFNDKREGRFSAEQIAMLERIAGLVAAGLAQRQSAEALRQSETRFRLAMEAADEGLWDWNIPSGHIYRSPRFYTMLGYEPGQIPAGFESWTNLLHPQDQARTVLILHNYLDGGQPNYEVEFRLRSRDGSWQWILSRGSVVERDLDGRPIRMIGTHLDITKRKRTEEALHRSEAIHRALVERLPDFVMRFDRDGRHLFVSNNVEEVVDLRADQFIGKTHRELGFPEAKCQFWEEAIRKVFDTQTSCETEFTFEGKHGPVIHNWRLSPERDDQGQVASVLSISRDVTAHRRAERDYQTLFREMLDGFALHEILCDAQGEPANYRFLAANPAFERCTGLKAEDIVGKTVLEVLPNTEAHWIKTYGQVALTGEPVFFENYSGALDRHFTVTAFCPGINQFACIFHDITDRMQAEQDREKLQAQLLQAQKMESVGRLAGGIAHDFNNMLSVILGHTEMALEQVCPSQPPHDDLLQIQKAAQRSADLTRQLLAFARKQTVSPKALQLNDTVSGMLEMLQRLIGEDVTLEWRPGPELWTIKMDSTQIDQILANLSVNARDAMPDGGRLILETRNAMLDESYCAAYPGFTPGDYVQLTVSDTGVGMGKGVLQHLFEPFFTTKAVGKGTGLGLATVYGILKQNQGFINIYSEPGQGTAIRIYLPRHVSDAALTTREALTAPTAHGRETLLFVEDEPAILRLGRTVLERAGYHVLIAGSPHEAIELANTHTGDIPLLITDVVMPEMNGRELAKHLLDSFPAMRCLFMSGYTADVIAHHGVVEEGMHFLQKPFCMKDLAAKVREVLDAPAATQS